MSPLQEPRSLKVSSGWDVAKDKSRSSNEVSLGSKNMEHSKG